MAKHDTRNVEVFKQKPRLSIGSKALPAVKDWHVGEEYEIKKLKVRQTSAHLDEDGEIMGEFEVKGARNSKYRSTSDGKMRVK